MVCHVVCSLEKIPANEGTLLRSDKIQWNALYYSAESSYEWKECLDLDICRHIIHANCSLEEAKSYPKEWVKELFGFSVHTTINWLAFICFTDDTGLFHRTDGPAVEYINGTVEWYVNGIRHREDGPAVIMLDGTCEWYANDQLYRENGPAVEYSDGTVEWWLNGNLHRDDGPAVIYADGGEEWWIHGNLHHEKGPTTIPVNGEKEQHKAISKA